MTDITPTKYVGAYSRPYPSKISCHSGCNANVLIGLGTLRYNARPRRSVYLKIVRKHSYRSSHKLLGRYFISKSCWMSTNTL
ncbi:hypothetical protein J6590_092149 [Homalodisca vitripennis]|nr:hypothetical protein J6590_092149 [Homalodisca vitripennis]